MDKEQRKEQLAEAKKKLRPKAREFHKLFTSPTGRKVLGWLEEEFNPDVLLGNREESTDYRVGKRDAFIYIQQMIRYEDNARELER